MNEHRAWRLAVTFWVAVVCVTVIACFWRPIDNRFVNGPNNTVLDKSSGALISQREAMTIDAAPDDTELLAWIALAGVGGTMLFAYLWWRLYIKENPSTD